MTRSSDSQSGSIVLGWLTKLSLSIALVGVLAFDGIALVKTSFNAADHANTAALAAADVYKQSKNVQTAYNAAAAAVAANGDTIDPKTFLADPTTGRIRLQVTEEAVTLWLHKVGPLKKYAIVHASGEATPSP